MSIRKNTVANFAGRAYSAAIGILVLPVYLEFLGPESFGLVGFFALLHSWLALLNAGVAPTFARQVALYRGRGELSGRPYREMLRSLELIVLGLGLATGLLIWLGSDWLATQWLTVKVLASADVAYCIALMGVIIGLRWIVALYSSGITGLERQVWLNGFQIASSTLRFGGAYVLLRWVSHDVVHYFEFQLAVSLLELLVIGWKFYACQPIGARQNDPGLVFSWPAIRPVLPFVMGVAYTSMLWVLMTQADKLILSHVLTLEEYGYFAVVILIANGVLLFSHPIIEAVLPRLTVFHSQGNDAAMLALYRTTTQFLAVIGLSVAGMLALFSESLIVALTGNQAAAAWGAPVLTWFALGNGILIIAGMQYALQFAHGQVRMHVINTTINVTVQLPILAFMAFNYGAVEVAMAWFGIRLTTLFIWPAIVHHKFAPGLHWKWLGNDVLLPALGALLGLAIIKSLMIAIPQFMDSLSRLQTLVVLFASGIGVLAISSLAASELRMRGMQLVKYLSSEFRSTS